MPWNETVIMEQRLQFIIACKRKEYSVAELCRQFGISRKTGYKWLERYESKDLSSLYDRSRARHQQALRISTDVALRLIVAKHAHPDWGPRKIRDWFRLKDPEFSVPAASTIGDLFKKNGLVNSLIRRPRPPCYHKEFTAIEAPNDVWSADFKGDFLLGNKRRCYPFTLTDNHSRFILSCQGTYRIRGDFVVSCLEKAFYEYGLPYAIRTDNGKPFAGSGLAGLSQLSVWLIKLGILPERIDLGHPEQNGRHERMHRSLKTGMIYDRLYNDLSLQQDWFDHYVAEFNNERPHESLNGLTPGHIYKRSQREYDGKTPQMTLPDDKLLKKVGSHGLIRWGSQRIFVSEVLDGEYVCLTQEDERLWRVEFGPLLLGYLDNQAKKIIRPKKG
ncbi:DDE-type integrase/transposase/recombinase [Parachlamydia acanthamoebae]|nr:DDE-type integrase/transposase/recombinase [Parachlamydia acanthamoebae]